MAGHGGDEDHAAGASSLCGMPWVLAAGLDVAGWERAAPSATFADGRVAGSTGCNRFTAPTRSTATRSGSVRSRRC
jgi:META domain